MCEYEQMVKNEKVIVDFIKGIVNKNKNLYSEKSDDGVIVLYSYGEHYPLSVKLLDEVFLINDDDYSRTSSNHRGTLSRALNFQNYKDLKQSHNTRKIFLFDTNKIISIRLQGIKTSLEIIESNI